MLKREPGKKKWNSTNFPAEILEVPARMTGQEGGKRLREGKRTRAGTQRAETGSVSKGRENGFIFDGGQSQERVVRCKTTKLTLRNQALSGGMLLRNSRGKERGKDTVAIGSFGEIS